MDMWLEQMNKEMPSLLYLRLKNNFATDTYIKDVMFEFPLK